jgi:hypothetical protein
MEVTSAQVLATKARLRKVSDEVVYLRRQTKRWGDLSKENPKSKCLKGKLGDVKWQLHDATNTISELRSYLEEIEKMKLFEA